MWIQLGGVVNKCVLLLPLWVHGILCPLQSFHYDLLDMWPGTTWYTINTNTKLRVNLFYYIKHLKWIGHVPKWLCTELNISRNGHVPKPPVPPAPPEQTSGDSSWIAMSASVAKVYSHFKVSNINQVASNRNKTRNTAKIAGIGNIQNAEPRTKS